MTAGPDLLTRSIDALASGRNLDIDDTAAVLSEIMAGNATEIQIAGFLIALRTKGETVEELAGLARAMRSLATPVRVERSDLLDTAGTGGGRRTFNVSTTAALIAAGAGCTVAKHGNRSATGLSGSADVLEALGARIDLDPGQVATCIEDVGFGFMFAPAHHQATRYVVPVRRQLAVRTIFNFLGPLTNPAGATRQLIGVSDPAFLETMAGALALLGTEHALLVSSEDGIDELSICAPTTVVEVLDGEVRSYSVAPEDVGLPVAGADEIPGGTPHENAETARRIFAGEPGAPRDLAVLNAGAAIYAGGRADSLKDGVAAAQAAIDDGSSAATLKRYVDRTHEFFTPGMNALTPIIARTRDEVAQRRKDVPLAALEEGAAAREQRGFAHALATPGLSIIAEHKRRSPSAGVIREGVALEEIVRAYERGGAAALSVLTERHSFGGSLADLRAARAAASLPILRKDFVVDPYQVVESAAAGADAILLIVAALGPEVVGSLHAQASALGLDVLVEVHDERELEQAAAIGAQVIGINNRDLTTLEVDTRRTFELLARMPSGVITVSESGFSRPDELDELSRAGVDAVLIGEALMRSPDVEAACRALCERTAARAL